MKTSQNLSAEESLQIITSMINQAKGNIKRNSFYFLLWGWIVVIANLGVFIMLKLELSHPYYVWLIALPAWILTMYRSYKSGRSGTNLTHLAKTNIWLWATYGITIVILIFFGYKLNYHINPLILLTTATPTFVSGIIIRFKPLIIGGVLFWLFGIIGFIVPFDYQTLIAALAITTGYLIPGYLLKAKQES
jgi:hypothetical protein